jgi:hypothetical protein
MVAQLRIYTISDGMMDPFIKIFNEHIRPLHQRLGIPVVAAYTNDDRTEFIWVRQFSSLEELPAKEAEFRASPERQALGNLRPYIAKMEVRLIHEVPTPARVR